MGHASRKNRLRKKGGKFIFAGTSGCGFSNPPLKCMDEPARRSNEFMTKLMDMYTGVQEIQITTFLEGIDPNQQYFLYPQRVCALDKEDIKASDEIEKCNGYNEDNYDTLVINTNGGNDLNKLKIAYEDYIEFFNSLTNIFDGLALLHKNYCVHADIKPPNIVTMKKYPNIFHTRLIDFGLSASTLKPNIRKSTMANIFTQPYLYWPLDVAYVYQEKYDNYKKFLQKDIDAWYLRQKYNRTSIPGSSYWNKDGNQSITPESMENIIKQIDYNKYPFHKVDVFSLGHTLGEIYTKLIGHNIKMDVMKVDYEKPSLPSPHMEEFIAWNDQVAKYVTRPINHLIFDMIHVNPNQRPDVTAAGERYKMILVDIQKLFTADNLMKYCVNPNNNFPEIPELPQLPTSQNTSLNYSTNSYQSTNTTNSSSIEKHSYNKYGKLPPGWKVYHDDINTWYKGPSGNPQWERPKNNTRKSCCGRPKK